MAFTFTVGCPACAGELDLVNPGTALGTESKVLTRCEPCKRDFLIYARIAQAGDARRNCAA